MPDREEALLAAFERSGIRLVGDPGGELIGLGALDVLPVQTPAFVITAENPGGARAPDADNDRWTAELSTVLQHRGVRSRHVVAGSGRWRERGYLVAAAEFPLADALAVAARFGQHSVFRLTTRTVEIVRVSDGVTISRRPRRHGDTSAGKRP